MIETAETPILYSFRRCPYAMRARMALQTAGETCELREVVLRDKPAEMLAASPKGTVPVVVLPGGTVIEESLDVMLWALERNDPAGWLAPDEGSLEEMLSLIDQCENDFKGHLDRYKYTNRYEGADSLENRAEAEKFLAVLEARLKVRPWLFGKRPALADFAIAPFIRQFANTDREWFDRCQWSEVRRWLEAFLELDIFSTVMPKFAKWQKGDEPTWFPAP